MGGNCFGGWTTRLAFTWIQIKQAFEGERLAFSEENSISTPNFSFSRELKFASSLLSKQSLDISSRAGLLFPPRRCSHRARGALLTTALLRFAQKQASQCYSYKTEQGGHACCSKCCPVTAGNPVVTLGSPCLSR